MHEVARELDHVGETRALRGKRGAEMGEHLRALSLEIGGRLAVPVDADLAGHEEKLGGLDARDVRIGRNRLGEAVGIEHLDRWHRWAPRGFRCCGRCDTSPLPARRACACRTPSHLWPGGKKTRQRSWPSRAR